MLFKSTIERRVALPLIFAITLPILAVALFATQQIRQATMDAAEDRLEREAKNYGLLILERIKNKLPLLDNRNAGRVPLVTIDDDQFVVRHGPRDVLFSLNTLTHDIELIADLTRCVEFVGKNICSESESALLLKSWHLRLVGQFATNAVISVTVSQTRANALGQIGEVTRVLPYVMALVASLIGYGLILYLRRKFKPVPMLERAIKEIEAGRYEHRVEINSQDEFSILGNALNSMSDQLGNSFGYRDATSLIDEEILGAGDPHKIFTDLCVVAVGYCQVRSAFVIFPVGDKADVVGLFEGKVQHIPNVSDMPVDKWRPMLGCDAALPITREQQTWAWFAFDTNNLERDVRLQELAHRGSVAVTNDHQSKQLFARATYDGLTGLLNRFSFNRELERIVQERHRSSELAALIFLDLDNFKNVNDTEGHSIGDQLLCAVAERLKKATRSVDILARLGGDEFAIALSPFNSKHELLEVMRRISQQMEQPFKVGRFEHKTNCSMGICMIPEDGDSADILLRNADLAMYKAKELPGTAFLFFNASYNEDIERRVLLEGKLRKALQDEVLTVHLQPKLHLASQTITSCEALIRWYDHELGHVSPQEFVEIAERAGLIEELTEFVLKQVSEYLKSEFGYLFHSIAINVSPIQLAGAEFVSQFLALLEQYQCDLGQIEVEITESVFVADPLAAQAKIQALKDAGVRVSLDDFGTGYSSLSLLTQLPIDALKIDKSFVDRIPNDAQATMVATKIIEMATALNIDTIAEGVEEGVQLDVLADMGTTYIQGYFISKPLPFDAVCEFLENQRLNATSKNISSI